MFLMPEDKRLSGTACLQVPEGSAELARNLRPDWVSLLVPVGRFAERVRRPSRTTETNDLTASLRSDRRSVCVGRVLNLCEAGMRVQSSSDLEVGEIAGFDLAGPGFRYVGFAAVAHRTAGSIGLRFVTWEGPVDRSIRALVAARLSSGRPGVMPDWVPSRIGPTRPPASRSITGTPPAPEAIVARMSDETEGRSRLEDASRSTPITDSREACPGFCSERPRPI